jgi:probable HAF family extracellular repeat protein
MNDLGHVVGISMTNYGERGFVWTAETGIRDLGPFPGGVYGSRAAGINNAGQVVGNVGTLAGDWHAFIWTSATGMQDLGALRHLPQASANAINESSSVAGCMWQAGGSSPVVHAALWKPDGTILDLGVLPGGDEYSTALALNNLSQIVGEATVGNNNRAFLWTAEDGMLDLNNLLQTPLEGWTLLEARGINDLGQIVGEAKCPTGTHAFLLTPIPEPAGPALLAVCVLGFLRQRGTYQLGSSWSRCGTAQNTTEITNRRRIQP